MNVSISFDFIQRRTRENSEPFDLKDFCTIVIDVLRASTTICTLLELCDNIYITDSVEEASTYNNAIKIGERNGKKLENFDFGNSPIEIRRNKDKILSQVKNGKDIVLTTTNGTRILKSITCDHILLGSITNAKYVAEKAYQISKEHNKDILLIPCHRKGKFAIEDFVGAGLITDHLLKLIKEENSHHNEELTSARCLTKMDWKSLIMNSNSANNLKNLGYYEDLIFCTSENIQKTVGMYKDGKIVRI
jgi:2-phosphosulfolactate phosphatase